MLLSNAISHAAGVGRLDIVKMLRMEYNCPWDKTAYLYAAANNHADVYDWLAENGCPPHPKTYGQLYGQGPIRYVDNLDWVQEVPDW